MQKTYQYLDVDINKKIHRRLRAVQGDTKSRYILVNLFENSKSFNLSNCSIKIFGIKSDKKIFFNFANILDATKGKFEIELTTQALAVAGELEIQLLILGGNGERLTSFNFYIDVEKSIVNDAAIESTNEFTALADALGQVQNIDNRFQDVTSQLDAKANSLSGHGINVLDFGLDNTGENDCSVQLQNLINNQLNNFSNNKYHNLLLLPKGVYKLSNTINLDPRIKLKTLGTVIFEYTGNSVCLNIEQNQLVSTDYYKEMYNRGSIIDGANGGLIVRKYNTDKVGTGLKFGNSVNGVDLGRTCINDVAIHGFEVGFNLSSNYDTYLNKFLRLHLEGNSIEILVNGDSNNSGENICFEDCVISTGIGIQIIASNQDLTFTRCSFDFCSSVVVNNSNGYYNIKFSDCYFEGVSNYMIDNIYTGTKHYESPEFLFSNCLIYTKRKKLFINTSSKIYVVSFDNVSFRSTSTGQGVSNLVEDLFLIEQTPYILCIKKNIYSSRNACFLVGGINSNIDFFNALKSKNMNFNISNKFNFHLYGDGDVGKELTDSTLSKGTFTYKSKSSNINATISNLEKCSGNTSLNITATTSGQYIRFTDDIKHDVSKFKFVHIGFIYKTIGVSSAIKNKLHFELYDNDNNLLHTSTDLDAYQSDLEISANWKVPTYQIKRLRVPNNVKYIKLIPEFSGFLGSLIIDQIYVEGVD